VNKFLHFIASFGFLFTLNLKYIVFFYGVATSKTANFDQYIFSLNVIRVIKTRRMRWAGHVSWMGKKENIHADYVGKSERKRSFGRTGRRWVYLLTYLITNSMEQIPIW